jgi:hypothetical protein
MDRIDGGKKLLGHGGNGKKAVDRRAHLRIEEHEMTSFVDESGEVHECAFVDLSAGGLRITTEAALYPGDVINFVSPAYSAVVCWVKGDKIGLRFI